MEEQTGCLQLKFFAYARISHTVLSIFLRFFLILQHVEPVVIAQKVIQGVYPGVTTMELDE